MLAENLFAIREKFVKRQLFHIAQQFIIQNHLNLSLLLVHQSKSPKNRIDKKAVILFVRDGIYVGLAISRIFFIRHQTNYLHERKVHQ
jgi:hypothetical protein